MKNSDSNKRKIIVILCVVSGLMIFCIIINLGIIYFSMKVPLSDFSTPLPLSTSTPLLTSTSKPVHFENWSNYAGSNPNVAFEIEAYEIVGFGTGVTFMDYFEISIPVGSDYCHVRTLSDEPVSITDDGSFVWERSDKGKQILHITGVVIPQATAHGEYWIAQCYKDDQGNLVLDTPLTGKWQARFALPTPLPADTPIPNPGHYSGAGVSFDLDEIEISNFQLSVGGCTFNQDGRWWLGAGGSFNAQANGGNVSGMVKGYSAQGSYVSTCGQGKWSANLQH
jgi:hypothetical protein